MVNAVAVAVAVMMTVEGLPRAGAGGGFGLTFRLPYTVRRIFGEAVARRTRPMNARAVTLLLVLLLALSCPPQY